MMLDPDPLYIIRPVETHDLASVLGIYQESEDFLALGPESTASMTMVINDMDQSRNSGGRYCGIFLKDQTMIGIVDYILERPSGDHISGYVSLLMIAGPYRNQGIGSRIVRAVERVIWSESQSNSIMVSVQINNPNAIRFWKRHGYRIIGSPEKQPDQTTVFHLRKVRIGKLLSFIPSETIQGV